MELSENSSEKKRETFGNRHLTEDQNVFQYNAWYWKVKSFCKKTIYFIKKRDNVEWDKELIDQAEEKIKSNSSSLLSPDKAGEKFNLILKLKILKFKFFLKKILKKMPTNFGTNFMEYMTINFSKIETGCSLNFPSYSLTKLMINQIQNHLKY